MAIKSAGTPLKWSEIQTEFGPTPTSMSNMKQYRDIDPVGGITDLSLDEEYSVGRFPTSGEVKFSDFYGKRLNIIVNYYDTLSTGWSLVYNAFSVSPVYRVRLVVATGVYTYTANNADVGTSTDTTLDLGSTRYSVGDEVTDTGDSKIFKIKIEQQGNSRVDAKLKYDSGTIGQDFVVVGGLRGKPGTTAGCKVRIHVNQEIVSAKGNPEICALKTGNWSGDTILAIDVGANGKIYGAGGNGGGGAGNGDYPGGDGGDGTSGIGIEHTTPGFTYVNIMSGGLVRAGYGGGGGGGGSLSSVASGGVGLGGIRVGGQRHHYHGIGGGGGGGAGNPIGDAGPGGNNTYGKQADKDGDDGTPGTITDGGVGGDGTDSGHGVGGRGGDGGDVVATAQAGTNASSGNERNSDGGAGGADGAAIRKAASVSVVTVNTTGAWNNNVIGDTVGNAGASGVQ